MTHDLDCLGLNASSVIHERGAIYWATYFISLILSFLIYKMELTLTNRVGAKIRDTNMKCLVVPGL